MRKIEKIINKRGDTRLNPGLKKIHIGENIWLIGRRKQLKDGRFHSVIYGPDRKEYHVYDKDLDFICNPKEDRTSWYDGWDGTVSFINRNGNRAIESNLKIYILTHILDSKENWEFDLSKFPKNGPLKVIYDNGTIKNIEFEQEFKDVEIKKRKYNFKRIITPKGYRLC